MINSVKEIIRYRDKNTLTIVTFLICENGSGKWKKERLVLSHFKVCISQKAAFEV